MLGKVIYIATIKRIVSSRISLQWVNYLVNSVDKPHIMTF